MLFTRRQTDGACAAGSRSNGSSVKCTVGHMRVKCKLIPCKYSIKVILFKYGVFIEEPKLQTKHGVRRWTWRDSTTLDGCGPKTLDASVVSN